MALRKFTNKIRLEVAKLQNIQDKKDYLINFMGETNNVQYGKLRNKIRTIKSDTELEIIMFNMQLMSEGNGVL